MTQQNESLKNELAKIDKKLINQSEIARRLGVHYSYISLILSGKRKNDKLLQKIIEIIKNAA